MLQLKLQINLLTHMWQSWNPRNSQLSTSDSHHSTTKYQCSVASPLIFASNYSANYEELVNFVQRHTKCSESTCLHKKGTSLQCRYGFPYELQATSSLFIDPNGRKTYNPTRNYFLLNIHNPTMLSIWRASVYCQPVLCKHVVLKYISKYASKVEPKLETYHAILSRLAHAAPSESPILHPIKQLLAQTVREWDISAQETCHMLQKLPLVLCRCHFFSLDVS